VKTGHHLRIFERAQKWMEDDLILREVWVSRSYRLREAQRIVRALGYKWREVHRGESYWMFPQAEGGRTKKLVRLAPGVWAIYAERCD